MFLANALKLKNRVSADDKFWTGNAFAFTVKTDNTGTSNDDQFTIPIDNKVVDASIYWGDDTVTNLNSGDGQQTAITHTYPSAGTYNIYILETVARGFSKMRFNAGGDCLKMINIANWGILNIEVANTFRGCSNMTCTATTAPVYPASGNVLQGTFRDCTSFNGAIGNWNVSSCTDINKMFQGAIAFNQPLENWNVSSISNFSSMFNNARIFNQSLNSWDMSSATTTSNMFEGADAFNQPLNSWDMSSNTKMEKMFFDADAFNQDLSAWDFEGLTHGNALVRFIKNTSMHSTNYSALLIRWAAQDVLDSLTVDSGNIQYLSSAASARQSLIDDDKWTITDGGQV